MTYVSLYRKYRSKTFEDLVGQDHITTTLKNAIEKNRIGHAYLFSGPRGTGKTSTARIFAKALNCRKGPASIPCNECDICQGIATDSLFDVIEIDAASNRGIDDIRELREKVRVPPSQARFKVYIIDEVHMLTKEAFNALLKTLEEPPSYVKFLMATTEPQKLLSTILSRCQRFDFRRLTDEEIGNHIRSIAEKENFTIDDGALATVVKTADGSMRDSISILDQLVSFSAGNVTYNDVNSVFGLVERGEIAKFMNSLFAGDVSGTFDIFNSFFQAGKSFSLFLRYLMEYVRDLYLIKQKVRPSRDLYNDEELKPLLRQAKAVSRESLVAMLDEMSRVEDRIRWETYPRIVLEVMVVKLLDLVSGPGLVKDAAPADSETADLREQPSKKSEPAPEEVKEPEKPAPPRRQAPPAAEERKTPPPERKAPPRRAPEPPEPDEDDIPDPEPPADIVPGGGARPARESAEDKAPANIVPEPEDEYPPVEDIAPELEKVGEEQLDRVRAAWKKILEEIKKNNVPSYFHIASGVPVEVSGGSLVLEFDPDHRFQMEQSRKAANREVLEKALLDVLEAEYMVRCRVAESAEGEAGKSEPPAGTPEEKPATPPVEPAKPEAPAAEEKTPAPQPAQAREKPEVEPPAAEEEKKKREEKSGPRELSLFDTLTEVFPDSKEIE